MITMMRRPAHETLQSVPASSVTRKDAALVVDQPNVNNSAKSASSSSPDQDALQQLMLVKPKPKCRLFPISDAKQLSRNRKLINKYLKRVSGNQSIELDANGRCYLPVTKFLICVEVPDNGTGLCYLNTKVYDLNSIASSQTKSRKKIAAIRMNDTKTENPPGALVDLDGNEINLYFSVPIDGLKYNQLHSFMEAFIQKATKVNSKLRAVV
jgi:hypothetical protein